MTQRLSLHNPALLAQANYIGGKWIAAGESATPVIDPSTGDVIGKVPNAGADEARAAIEAAHQAFPEWRAKTATERAVLLRRLASLITENTEDLARILTTEQGKSLREARGEIGMSAAYILWFAEEGRRTYGDVVPSPWADRRILVTKEPVGVVAAITPWNFPSSMLARKLGPGARRRLHHRRQAGIADALFRRLPGARCARRPAFPKGVVNIVTGSAGEIGGEIMRQPAGAQDHLHRLDRDRQDADRSSAPRPSRRCRWSLAAMRPSSSSTTPISTRAVEGAIDRQIPQFRPDLRLHQPLLSCRPASMTHFVEKLAAAVGNAEGRQRPRGRRRSRAR